MSRVRSWMRHDSMSMVFAILALLLLVFILAPIVKMAFWSSPGTLWNTLCDESVYSSILLTILAGLVATLIGIALGVPLAYLLARRQFRGKRFLEALIDVPIVIPHSAAGIALLFVFGRQFLLGKLFGHVDITFRDTLAGVVIAMVFVSVPFLIDSAKDAFKGVDVRMEKVARTLGASPWQTFFRVSLPLAWRGIFSGSVMMWARAMSEFGAVMVLAYYVPFLGGQQMVAPVLVWFRFDASGLDSALPVASLVIIISLVIFVALRYMALRGEKE
jgi:molybdate/tungstate transport system permease protein